MKPYSVRPSILFMIIHAASGRHLPDKYNVKPTIRLLVLGAVFGVAGTLLYLSAANSDTTPAAPAPIPYIKAVELLRHASPARLALRSQGAPVLDERARGVLYGE